MYPTWGPRRPQVPLLGLHVPQLGPPRPILNPRTRPRGLLGRCWDNFGPLREALQALKHCKVQGFCCISRSATETVQNVEVSPWEDPKRLPGGAQERPRRPRSGPRGPKTARERPRSLPNSASERPWRSHGVHLVPESLPEASASLFWTPPGRFSTLRGTIST